ncbi:hypothetical protein [Streptomyces sp. NPDC098101]|uniref:hypothetical protein n=1 Tax=Streptomyces sp. NPDC098101 TaxID=3366096 RepID=UPI00381ABF06
MNKRRPVAATLAAFALALSGVALSAPAAQAAECGSTLGNWETFGLTAVYEGLVPPQPGSGSGAVVTVTLAGLTATAVGTFYPSYLNSAVSPVTLSGTTLTWAGQNGAQIRLEAFQCNPGGRVTDAGLSILVDGQTVGFAGMNRVL